MNLGTLFRVEFFLPTTRPPLCINISCHQKRRRGRGTAPHPPHTLLSTQGGGTALRGFSPSLPPFPVHVYSHPSLEAIFFRWQNLTLPLFCLRSFPSSLPPLSPAAITRHLCKQLWGWGERGRRRKGEGECLCSSRTNCPSSYAPFLPS